MPFTDNAQDKDNPNAIWQLLTDRFAAIADDPDFELTVGGNPFAQVQAGDALAAAYIAALQTLAEDYAAATTVNGEQWARDLSDKDAIEYYTLETAFADAGLWTDSTHYGFRRLTSYDEDGDPVYEYGHCQAGDYVGRHIWDDLKAFVEVFTTSAGGAYSFVGDGSSITADWGEGNNYSGGDPAVPPGPQTTGAGAWGIAKTEAEADAHPGTATAYPHEETSGGYVYDAGAPVYKEQFSAYYECGRGMITGVVEPAAGSVAIWIKYLEKEFQSDNYVYTGPEPANTWATIAADTWIGSVAAPSWCVQPTGNDPAGATDNGWRVGGTVLTITNWTF